MKNFTEIQKKYMWWWSNNFYNNQNYCLWRGSKDLINYLIYGDYVNMKPYWFFLKNKLTSRKSSINWLMIISLIFSEWMVFFLYLGWTFSSFFELLIMLTVFWFVWLFPFLLFNSNSKRKKIIFNSKSFLAKCPHTKEWIIVYEKAK